MKIICDIEMEDLSDILWGNAYRVWSNANFSQREEIFNSLEKTYGNNIPSEDEINDFVAFECSSILEDNAYAECLWCGEKIREGDACFISVSDQNSDDPKFYCSPQCCIEDGNGYEFEEVPFNCVEE